MDTQAAVLAVALVAGGWITESHEPVTIYVGPVVRNGFVDADEGVLDSVKDIQSRLRKNRAFAVVASEARATLKLFVVSREDVEVGSGSVVTTGTARATGNTVQGISTSTEVRDVLHRLETLLQVGEYEKTIIADSDWVVGQWGRCAGAVVKDVTAWLEANRSRLP